PGDREVTHQPDIRQVAPAGSGAGGDSRLRTGSGLARRLSLPKENPPGREPGGSRAGDGNRTRVPSLGSSCSTIELHPQGRPILPGPDPSVIGGPARRGPSTGDS